MCVLTGTHAMGGAKLSHNYYYYYIMTMKKLTAIALILVRQLPNVVISVDSGRSFKIRAVCVCVCVYIYIYVCVCIYVYDQFKKKGIWQYQERKRGPYAHHPT